MQTTPYRILTEPEPIGKTLVNYYVKPQSGHTTKYRSESNAGIYSSTNIDESIFVRIGREAVLDRTASRNRLDLQYCIYCKVITDAELGCSLKY
jgi:hypothetical protein